MATGMRCTVLVTVDIVRERDLSMKEARRGRRREEREAIEPKLSQS
jgi:hypothetical protein